MNSREKVAEWLRALDAYATAEAEIPATVHRELRDFLATVQPGEPVAWIFRSNLELLQNRGRVDLSQLYRDKPVERSDADGWLPLYLAPPSRDKPGFFYLTESGQVLPWQEVARLLREAGHDVMVQPGFSYQPSREREAMDLAKELSDGLLEELVGVWGRTNCEVIRRKRDAILAGNVSEKPPTSSDSREREAMTEEKAEELVNLFWAAIEDAVGAIGTPTTEEVRRTRQDLVDAILAAQDGTDPRHGLEENGNNYIRWARTKAEIRKAFLAAKEVDDAKE